MDLDIKSFEEIASRMRSKPVSTTVLIIAMLILLAGGAWIAAYFSKWGEIDADPHQASPSETITAHHPPHISQVLISGNSTENRVQVTFENPSSEAVNITSFDILASHNDPIHCNSAIEATSRRGHVGTFDVHRDSYDVQPSTAELVANYTDGANRFPMRGTVAARACSGAADVALHTEASVVLPAERFPTVVLLLPRHMRVARVLDPNHVRAFVENGRPISFYDVDLTSYEYRIVGWDPESGWGDEFKVRR